MKNLFSLILLFSLTNIYAKDIGNTFNSSSEKLHFAANEIENGLQKKGIKAFIYSIIDIGKINKTKDNIVLMSLKDNGVQKVINQYKIQNIDELKEEGFIIHVDKETMPTIFVIGYDEAGAMYGGLEVAELINVKGIEAIDNKIQNPYMKMRGVKYNIPLDMRSPTYTEPSDAAQKNMNEMWSFEFWKTFIDNMARYRYNLISLWNMHPFPSMVKVPEYPNIALNDVRKSTGIWKENYSLNGWGFDAPEVMKSFEVLKKMTIEEKINFWRKVMAYGKERNVKFYIITWNIFVYGVDGKYGITDKLENPTTTNYFRTSVKQMLLTYPDLAGIGLTTGENMYDYSAKQKEDWAFATYGEGVLDALKEQPNRKIDFIHRQHQTQANEVKAIFGKIIKHSNVNFKFSFKYAQAHVYSSVKQTFHQKFVEDIQSENLKTMWELRNDDIYNFRWGAPDFVRDFIKNIPYDVSEGIYYGSDQYVWGKDFLTKNNAINPQSDIEKHWYHWMLWGRLGYNPNISNTSFEAIIQHRFSNVNAREMLTAWQNASMIYPLVTGFHWGALDFQWYIESGQSQPSVSKTPSGYHDANHFINLPPHKGTNNISIPDYVKTFLQNKSINGTSPLQVAENILSKADSALNWVSTQTIFYSKELQYTLDDITAMAWLGKYYAHKIKAATYLALFRETYQKEWHQKAIDEFNSSASYWRSYTSIGISNYQNPLWTNRVGIVDWKKNFQHATYEVTSNGGELNLTSMQPTPGGTILEAEDVCSNPKLIQTKVSGFTGKGYAGNSVDNHERQQLTFSYTAPSEGSYIFEFRYTLHRNDVSAFELKINDKKLPNVEFWSTGKSGTWVWDRIKVNLEKGKNNITISPEIFVLLDHLNIIKNN
jgi:Glycosyl hydrolase family 67 N-terminus